MDKTSISLWISTLALVVSAATALFQIYRAASQSQLERERARSNLLTQIVELKIGYEMYFNDLIALLVVTKRYGLTDDTQRLERMLSDVDGFGKLTKQHYERLLAMTNISHKGIEEIKHHFDALRARVNADRDILKNVKNTVSKAEEDLTRRLERIMNS